MTADNDQNDKAGETPSSAETAAPEVEAEVVSEAATEETAAFDETAAPEPPAARKSTLTPGVMLFIGFAIVALGLFFFWRLQPTQRDNSAPVEVATEEPAAKADVQATESPKPDVSTSAPVSEINPDLAGKIANDHIAPAKEALAENIPDTDDQPEDDTYLPPVGGNPPLIRNDESLRMAARHARNEEEATTDEPLPADEGVTGFEVENSEDKAPSETPSETQLTELAEAETLPATQDAAPIEDPALSAKINNDIDDLKLAFAAQTTELRQALEEERARSATLEEEIRAMREDFAEALASRDDAAGEEIASLKAQMEKIANEEDLRPGRTAMGAAALPNLRRAIDAGRSYAAELEMVAGYAPEAPLAQLRIHANEAPPSVMALKEGFGPAARDALAAAGVSGADTMVGRWMARLKSVISIRPASPKSGASPGAIISRAEAAVLDNDFATALGELSALPAPAQEAMEGWLSEAKIRAEIDTALDALDAYFLQASAG